MAVLRPALCFPNTLWPDEFEVKWPVYTAATGHHGDWLGRDSTNMAIWNRKLCRGAESRPSEYQLDDSNQYTEHYHLNELRFYPTATSDDVLPLGFPVGTAGVGFKRSGMMMAWFAVLRCADHE